MTEETCPKIIHWEWRSYPCGRPVKDEGLCGIHLRQKKHSDAKQAARDARADESDANLAIARAAIEKVGGGIPHYDQDTRKYTGKVIVDADHLVELWEDGNAYG